MAKVKSLADQVYEHIIEKIRYGELTDGYKIDEAALIEEIGISRTPIREALLMLAADHILEAVPRKGYFVKKHSSEELCNAYSVLACLEMFAIRQVIDKLDEYDFSKMSNLIELMDIAINFSDFPRYVENQQLFHAYCIDKVDNQTLIDTINSIKKQFPRQSYYSHDPSILHTTMIKSNEEHRQILQSIREKDIGKLEKQLMYHWVGNDGIKLIRDQT